ncbi:MAG: CopG family transcriptional regulator [Pyrinomonadaceae bacterium]
MAQINLTDSQTDALQKLARRTGKTEDELLQEAVSKLIAEVGEAETKRQKRLESLRRAKGIWKDRDDLPDFEKLRTEWDRFDFESG